MKKIITGFFLAASLMLCSCESVKSLINANPISSVDEQQKALNENSKNLSQLKSTDFCLNIGNEDFDTLLMPGIRSIINGKTISHIKNYQISKLVAKSNEEQIDFSADFQLVADTLDARIKGKLIGTVSFAFNNDSMLLFPAFKYVHVIDITFVNLGKLERKVIASLMNGILKIFINRLNGVMVSKTPAIPLNLIDREISAQELSKDPLATVSLSHPLKISTPVSLAACLLDKAGIHILGSFKQNTEDHFALIPVDFKTFQKAFLSKRKADFPELPDDKVTYMVLSKAAFSGIFNTALQDETINIKYANEQLLSDRADKNITINLDDIHCSDVHFDCPQLHVVPSCDCPIDFHCRGGILGAPCRAAEAAARASWFATVFPACQTSKIAELAVNETIKAQCAAARLAAIGSCELIKNSLEVVLSNKVSIGDIHTNIAASCAATGNISGIGLASDLSHINLSISAATNVNLQTSFGFTPQGPAGHLVCFLSFDHPYNLDVSASKTLATETISASFDTSFEKGLLLTFKTKPIDLIVDMNPTPLALMSRDIPTLINCPLLQFGLGLTNIVKGCNDIFSDGNFGNNIINAICNGQYKYTLQEKSFTLPIPKIQIQIHNNKIILVPIVRPTYIGFFK